MSEIEPPASTPETPEIPLPDGIGLSLEQARALEPAMQRVAPDAGFRFDPICEVPSFLGSADDPVTRALKMAGKAEMKSAIITLLEGAGDE